MKSLDTTSLSLTVVLVSLVISSIVLVIVTSELQALKRENTVLKLTLQVLQEDIKHSQKRAIIRKSGAYE